MFTEFVIVRFDSIFTKLGNDSGVPLCGTLQKILVQVLARMLVLFLVIHQNKTYKKKLTSCPLITWLKLKLSLTRAQHEKRYGGGEEGYGGAHTVAT